MSRIGIFRTKRPVSRGPTQSASQMGMCAQPISTCHGMRISARGGYFKYHHGCPGTRSGIVLLILLSIIIGARSGILLLILSSIWEPHARYPLGAGTQEPGNQPQGAWGCTLPSCPAEHITGCTLRRLRRASLICDMDVFCTTKYLLSLITTGTPNYRQPTQIRHSYHNHHLPIQNSSQNHLHTLFTQLLVLSSLSVAW